MSAEPLTHEEKVAIATAEYRGLLTKTEQESQAEFDKTILALSGGALGLSFAFIKDIVGSEHVIHTSFLLMAWIAWGFSSLAVLVSFFTSQLALRKAIRQLDGGNLPKRPGGWFDKLTGGLNLSGLILFIVGLTAMIVFLKYNLKDRMKERDIVTNIKRINSENVTTNAKRVPEPPMAFARSNPPMNPPNNAGRTVPEPPRNIVSRDTKAAPSAPKTNIP